MSDRDSIHRFVFERHDVRGKLINLNASWNAVLERHEYPPGVRHALGEALAAVALLTATLKFDGRVTLQIQGGGPLRLLVAQCTSSMTVRGLAHADDDTQAMTLPELVGEGRLAITIEPASGAKRYQGVVPLEGDTLAACVEGYFERSEQLPTRMWLVADGDAVVGMLLQRLPEEERAPSNRVDDDAWNRLCMLAATVTPEELLSLSDREILRRLFHEEDVRLFDSEPVSFRCSCSRERIAAALRGLGREEIDSIVEDHGEITTTCDFCNRRYAFDPIDAARLFAGPGTDVSGTQH